MIRDSKLLLSFFSRMTTRSQKRTSINCCDQLQSCQNSSSPTLRTEWCNGLYRGAVEGGACTLRDLVKTGADLDAAVGGKPDRRHMSWSHRLPCTPFYAKRRRATFEYLSYYISLGRHTLYRTLQPFSRSKWNETMLKRIKKWAKNQSIPVRR